jgi:4-hydroxyacetophenone monooxygenase
MTIRLDTSAAAITDDDATIRAALDAADVPPLLAAVAHLTGDLSLLRDEVRPNPMLMLEPDAGISPEHAALGRDLAAAALSKWRDGGCKRMPEPASDDLHRIIEYLVGGAMDEAYFPLLREELALDGDLRAPTWNKRDIAPSTAFTVAIVGAGMSGIAMAHRLQQAGVPFVIFEKNSDVGGTWFENTYPGCRVDVPNHLYSYSFAQTADWPGFFSSQDVLLEYFRACATEFGLRQHIRFNTEVLGATFDEAQQTWKVRTRVTGGSESEEEFQAIVSAVGQLNRPLFPNIEGRDRYLGPSFHSADWDDTVELEGKRVAVIGTGASAAQFVPRVADVAGELLVFQRTAPWLAPTPNYHDDLPSGLMWLLRHVPTYAKWDRLWLFWRTHESMLPMARVDPAWDGPSEQAVSAGNDIVRMMLTEYLRMTCPDEQLFEKIVPKYPPIAKRMLRDNGIWAQTMMRENVDLITEPIAEITEKGVRTADGIEHQVDVLIYGTGFQASNFLTPMKLTGRGGVDLHDQWDGNARAYLGITLPDFPNVFLMYGPNTNIVINGSIIYFSECEAHYILECIRLLLEGGHHSLEPRRDVHDEYNEQIDAENRQMAWGASKVSSWYKNAKGRVAQNWPFSLLEYWQRTRTPNPDEYILR